MRIANWDEWQTYRKDRGQPPWIKVYRRLLRNLDWIKLTDVQRGHLVQIWLLAADHDGEIPDNPEDIKLLCHLETIPDLQTLTQLGFIERDANMTPTCQPVDANMTPQIRLGQVSSDQVSSETDNPSNPSTDSLARQAFTDEWNKEAKENGFKPIKSWNDKRKGQFAKLHKSETFRESWKEAIQKIGETDWCCNRKPNFEFRASIDWFFRAGKFEEVLEFDNSVNPLFSEGAGDNTMPF